MIVDLSKVELLDDVDGHRYRILDRLDVRSIQEMSDERVGEIPILRRPELG